MLYTGLFSMACSASFLYSPGLYRRFIRLAYNIWLEQDIMAVSHRVD